MTDKWIPKVGDRVAIYANGLRYTGEIAKVCSTHTYEIKRDDGYGHSIVHRKQIQRLGPKKRREWWAIPNEGCICSDGPTKCPMGAEHGRLADCCIRVREVKNG